MLNISTVQTATGYANGNLANSLEELGIPGERYEQAVVKTVAGLFRENSTHRFRVTRFGVPGIYIRAGSSQHNEVVGH